MQQESTMRVFYRRNTDTIRLLFITIVIFITMSSLSSRFLRPNNFLSMGFQIPELGLYSIAMMLVMITGGRDLSIVGIGNLSCIVAALIMRDGYAAGLAGGAMIANILLGVMAALLVGVVCGLFNGIIVAFTGLPSMLVTMATSYIFTGIGVVLTNGEAISKVYPEYVYFGNNSALGLPIPLWFLIAALLITWLLLNKTRYGFEIKMVGSNPLASRFSGINIHSVLIKTYLISGIFCAVCGLEILARTDSAKANYALTYTFQAILCAVLGATDPNGGYGKVSTLVLSLISMQLLSSGFNMLRLGTYFKEFAWGVLLLVVLSANFLNNEISRRRYVAKMNKRAAQEDGS
jgi:simple sugar transport system permease protein